MEHGNEENMGLYECGEKLKALRIGDMIAKIPIIQGGMGVGISRSKLAGAVAAEGGIGIISTAQIGYDEENFENDQAECNLRAIGKHIRCAKEIAGGNGLVGANIMVALKHYKEHVMAAVAAGADVIISGAGLPVKLPEYIGKACRTKIAPIVSSRRAADIILKMWARRYDRTADFIDIDELDEIDSHQQTYLFELINYLLNWLSNHILGSDMKISEYIKENNITID